MPYSPSQSITDLFSPSPELFLVLKQFSIETKAALHAGKKCEAVSRILDKNKQEISGFVPVNQWSVGQ